ncbi:hypothetical protein GCM10010399_90360 [Dactylosporangium fulvum]
MWTAIGYLAGDHISVLESALHRYEWYAVAAAAVLALSFVVLRRIRRHR